jgi:hypothetical protein
MTCVIRNKSFTAGLLIIVALVDLSQSFSPPRYANSLVDAYDYMTTSSMGGKSENQGIFSRLFNF